jgi:hypothetical protein
MKSIVMGSRDRVGIPREALRFQLRCAIAHGKLLVNFVQSNPRLVSAGRASASSFAGRLCWERTSPRQQASTFHA